MNKTSYIEVDCFTNLVATTLHSGIEYGYNELGNITTRNDDAFDYNARSEVTGALLGGNNSYKYEYDQIGNNRWLALNAFTNFYTANALNQYTAITAPLREPQYDLDGNLLSNGSHTYTWDSENRLTSISINSVLTVQNSYDPHHRRVIKITPIKTNIFLYDGWLPITEKITYANNSVEIREHVWGKDLSGTREGAGGVGGLLATRINNSWYFPLYDNNGNITDYINESGITVAHREYDAFGNTIASSGTMVDTFNFWYSTKYLDHETNFYYYSYRFYDPALMRWLSRDPIGEQGGVNLYGFVGNDGVNRVDYLGLHNIQFDEGTIEYTDYPIADGSGWINGNTTFVGGVPLHAPKCICKDKKWRIDLTWVMKLRTRIAGINARHPESGKKRSKEGLEKTKKHEAYHRSNLKELFNEVRDSYNLSGTWNSWTSCQRSLTPINNANRLKINSRIRDEVNHTGVLWEKWFKENGRESVW